MNNDRRPFVSVRLNPVHGNGLSTYCKLSQYEYVQGSQNRYTFSFGTGRRAFCMIVVIHGQDYTKAYIDRIDRLSSCIKGRDLDKMAEGMVKFVQIGLYVIKQMCPWIERFTLKDDSAVVCNGVSGPSISMAYDYLIKYNMTWYQKKFGARLPDTMMDAFTQSLEVLDRTLVPFELIVDLLPEMIAVRDVYDIASSPRDFITQLRSRFEKPSDFCSAVSPWFDRYMNTLHIERFVDSWFIPVDAVVQPSNFSVGAAINADTMNRINLSVAGGSRRKTKKVSRWMGIVSRPLGGSIVASAEIDPL